MIVKKKAEERDLSKICWERVAAILISILVGGVLLYLFLQYALPLLLPFLLGRWAVLMKLQVIVGITKF